jgi:hypothetical protein
MVSHKICVRIPTHVKFRLDTCRLSILCIFGVQDYIEYWRNDIYSNKSNWEFRIGNATSEKLKKNLNVIFLPLLNVENVLSYILLNGAANSDVRIKYSLFSVWNIKLGQSLRHEFLLRRFSS